MTRRAHRRLRLPADDRSPAAARAAVRQVLLAGGREDRLEEALLLVSELSTNGVVHAGTAIDVDVLADEAGVMITVSDAKAGPLGAGRERRAAPPDPVGGGAAPSPDGGDFDDLALLEERGRGLVLVDELATSWGTSHHSGGKSVWFRLGGPGAGLDGPAGPDAPDAPMPGGGVGAWSVADTAAGPGEGASTAAAATAAALTLDGALGGGPAGREPGDPTRPPIDASGEVPPAAWVWLVHVPEGLRSRLSMPQLVSELLMRLCEVTGAAGGTARLDHGDSLGERALAVYPSPTAAEVADPDGAAGLAAADVVDVVVPLPVTRPLRGSLTLRPAAGSAPGRYWPELAALSAQRMAIGIDAERLGSEERRRRGWLTFLAEASELLANSLDVGLTVALVPQLAVPRLGLWCAVHTLAERGGLTLAAVSHADEEQLPRLQQLLGETAAPELAARLAEAAAEGATLALAGEAEGVVVPLSARGRRLGTLSVGRHADRLHAGEDIAVIEDIARRASLAIDNAAAHAERAQIAQDLQRALLPQELPVGPAVEFGAEYVPASSGSEVGGDFYDVFALEPDRWLVSIGDVCGKGTAAAVVTGVVRDVMRALVGESRSLPRMFAALNRALLAQASDRYATVATAMVTRGAAGDLDVALCLAGHDHPIVLRPDGTTHAVGECGTAVGLLEEFEVTQVELALRPGEALVFFTDGVSERRHGREMYGTTRLRRALRAGAGTDASAIAARLREDVVAFSPDPPRDDIAVLVLRNPA